MYPELQVNLLRILHPELCCAVGSRTSRFGSENQQKISRNFLESCMKSRKIWSSGSANELQRQTDVGVRNPGFLKRGSRAIFRKWKQNENEKNWSKMEGRHVPEDPKSTSAVKYFNCTQSN